MHKKPLSGVTVIEFEGIGPCPLAGMMLADMGADVVVISRKTVNANAANIAPEKAADAFYNRGKRSIQLDLKQDEGVQIALQLIAQSSILIEGFRQGRWHNRLVMILILWRSQVQCTRVLVVIKNPQHH